MNTTNETSNKPHVHKDLIIAWANGAKIEFSNDTEIWEECYGDPFWNAKTFYRIKKEPKVIIARCYIKPKEEFDCGHSIGYDVIVHHTYYSNLQLVFTDGYLTEAEVIKE